LWMLISLKHGLSPLWLWVLGFQVRCLNINNDIFKSKIY
jgi:hypothetical protein